MKFEYNIFGEPEYKDEWSDWEPGAPLVLSVGEVETAKDDMQRVSEDPAFAHAKRIVADLKQGTGMDSDTIAAYYVFLENKRKEEDVGLREGENETGGADDPAERNGFLKQARKVSCGISKPAYKSNITPVLVKALMNELGTQKKVAEHLGIDVKTVRSRLRQ